MTCSFQECDRSHYAKTLCRFHYDRQRVGKSLSDPRRNGRSRDKKGYVLVRNTSHPAASGWGYVPEHRIVMEEHLGRYLLPGENVHHKNGVRDDNRLENLELWVVSQPSGQRPEDLVAWAKQILERYGDSA